MQCWINYSPQMFRKTCWLFLAVDILSYFNLIRCWKLTLFFLHNIENTGLIFQAIIYTDIQVSFLLLEECFLILIKSILSLVLSNMDTIFLRSLWKYTRNSSDDWPFPFNSVLNTKPFQYPFEWPKLLIFPYSVIYRLKNTYHAL